MDRPKPLKAEDSPLAATLLAGVLMKASRDSKDPYQAEAALKLMRIAKENKGKPASPPQRGGKQGR